MAMDSPFLLFKIECPLCKTLNEFELIRVGAYTEEGRDTDFSPLNIKWRFPHYQGQHPLLYFTATCSNCFYTREFNNSYKDWKNDNQFRAYRLRQVKDRHLEQLSTADSVVKQLGEHIDIATYPNESAILKLLLAVFDEQLADHPSELDLGRFYLRIAWLFRERDKGENPHTLLLKGFIQELRKSYADVERALDSFSEQVTKLHAQAESQFASSQLPTELSAKLLTFKSRFDDVNGRMNDGIGQLQGHLTLLTQVIGDYREAALGTETGDGELSFGEYSSFAAFLDDMRARWEGVVVSERQALEKAVSHYTKAFADGRDISPGNQQIQASYLIAELSRRIGDYETAKQYFNSTIKTGQEFVYRNRNDQSRTALARKILELAIEQGRANLAAAKPQ